MNNLKHTPGPWRIERDYDNGHQYIFSENNRIAKIYQNWETMNANARLIAAAPEMLEALIEEYKHYLYGFNLKNRISKMNKLKQLIESATGMKIEEVIK